MHGATSDPGIGALSTTSRRRAVLPRGAAALAMALLVLLLADAALAGTPGRPAGGATPLPVLTLGVYADRPDDLLRERLQPLADYLSDALSDHRVRLRLLDHATMDEALRRNELDLVFTNPVHYIRLRERNAFTGVIATLVRDIDGRPVRTVGGVIVTRAGRADIRTLSDLAGLRIAAASPDLLGGFVAPWQELAMQGVDVGRLDVVFVGDPQDRVVSAVIAGSADAGFVRTGVLEALSREGRTEPQALKILNDQKLPDFPLALSTHLFPEWPVVALPHLDADVARRLSAALLALPPDHPAARAAGIQGFRLPADYSYLESVLRELRLPPFDAEPEIRWTDLWARYRLAIIALAAGILIILLLAAALVIRNRQLLAAQRASADVERRWVLALDGAGDGVWDWNARTNQVFFSRKWKRMLGFDDDEIGDRLEEWSDRVHPDDLPVAMRALRRHLSGETESYRNVHRMRDKSGRWRWILDRGMVFSRDAAGNPLRVVGTHTDISELRRAESDLAAEHALFAAIASQASDGVVVIDIETLRFVQFNDAACRSLGYDAGELGRLGLPDIQAELSAEEIRARIDEILAAGSMTFETRHRHKDGSLRPVRVSNRVLHRDEETVLAAIWVDLTDRLATERALRDSETRFRVTFEHAAVGIAHVAPDGRFLRVNPAFCAIMGDTEAGLLGTGFPEITHPDDLADTHRRVRQLLDGEVDSFRVEKRYLRRDGRTVWGEVTVALVRDAAGKPDFFVAVVEDIEQRKRDQAALEQANALYRGLFDTMRDGVAVYEAVDDGADFVFKALNPAGARSGLVDAQSVIGRSVREVFPMVEDIGLLEVFRRVHRSGRAEEHEVTLYADRRVSLWVENYVFKLPGGELVAVFADVSEQKAAEEALLESRASLQRMAYYDSLTGLPNRRLFLDRVSQAQEVARRTRTSLAVCYLDLDDFGPVNERLGRASGDALLGAVAKRLGAAVGAGDTVSRWGGDELALLLTGLAGRRACERTLDGLLAAIAEPYEIGEHRLTLSAGVGVALYPHNDVDGDTLLRRADLAMYAAKQRGGNNYRFFDPQGDRQALASRDRLRHIGEALDNDELCLRYQPIVDMRAGRLAGVEALVRWRHPQRGILPPAAFLPALQGSELLRRLDAWVLGRALDDLSSWIEQGLSPRLHVNVSAHSLAAPGFIDQVAALLERHPRIAADRLDLEILETAALEDLDTVTEVIRRGNELGLGFALDDFGTGYSSLTYFRHLPTAVLKIDQSFVRDMLIDQDDLRIVEAVIGLANAFNRRVIAEGVETEATGLMLLRFGCDLGQGFGIARPMPADRIPAWAAAYRQPRRWRSVAARSWQPEDLPLLTMEAEHRAWVETLIRQANGDTHARPVPLEVDRCRFGRWYQGEGQRRYGHLDVFRDMGPIHERVHALGAAVIRAQDSGRPPETALISELTVESNALADRLALLQNAVIDEYAGRAGAAAAGPPGTAPRGDAKPAGAGAAQALADEPPDWASPTSED